MEQENPIIAVQTPVVPSAIVIKPLFLVLAVFLLMGLASIATYLIVTKSQTTASKPETLNTPIVQPTTNETANWKMFSSEKYRFSLRFPNTWQAIVPAPTNNFEENGVLEFISDKAPGGEIFLEILSTESTTFEIQKKAIERYDWKNIVTSTVPVSSLNVFKQTGVDSRGKLHKVVIFEKWSHIYIFSTGLANEPDAFDQILSTFKFTGNTNQSVTIPAGWQKFTKDNPIYKIKTTLFLPPGYSINTQGYQFTLQSSDAAELWDYTTSVFNGTNGFKNYYDGGSRREWYQKFLSGNFLENRYELFKEGRITNVIERPVGDNSYLEITVSGGGNYVGTIGTHYIYVQNNILHMIKPASAKATSIAAELPKYLETIFFSINTEIIN